MEIVRFVATPGRMSMLAVLTLAALVGQSLLGVAATISWAPVDTASVHPGVVTITGTAQCTANFVFSDGSHVYLGQAAHCSSLGASTQTNGCTAASLPLGTPVRIDGASLPGSLVYSSWLTMRAVGEVDPNACAYNDFALVRVHPDDVARVNPTVPTWGGPVALGTSTTLAEPVYTYGNSSLRLGITLLSPKTGISLGQSAGGYLHSVYTVTPGIPGDSGSAFLNSRGEAVGVLTTLVILPLPASNGVADLNRALQYMYAHTAFDAVQLVPGTEPFAGLAGLVVGP